MEEEEKEEEERRDPVAMECSKSRRSCDLPDNCRVWFGHPVSNIF